MSANTYTEEQLRLALIEQQSSFLFKTLDRIESHQKWMLGLMGTGFAAVFGLIAHGFHWII